jgi:glycosyltransferase involved in cell wall biosynthesis
MATLTAIIPATDGRASLPDCTAAIAAASQPPDEVLVIDDPAGASPAEARNLGARRARSDLLVFIDSDVLVHRDAFARIRAAFEADPKLSAIFGSYDLASGDPGGVTAFRNLLLHEVHRQCAGSATTFWAGLGAVRRDAFESVGGFDARRYPRPSVEDIELGLRLSDRGARVELDPEILGTHLKRWSVGSMIRTDLVDRGLPWMRLALETKRLPAAMNLRWRHRLSAAASVGAAFALITRRPRTLAGCAATIVALNHRFYGLLRRRYGWRTAGAGLGLHVVHHLTSAVAAVGALAAHLRARSR